MQSADPTGTYLIRRKAVAAMQQRLSAFKAAIWAYLDPTPNTGLVVNVPAGWYALDAVGKAEAFREWLNKAVAEGFLDAAPGAVDHWYAEFTRSAYTKGVTDARLDVTPSGDDVLEDLLGNRYVSQQFTNGVALERVRLVFMRAYDKLKGITADMSAQIGAIMADGLAHNDSLNKIAKRIATEVDGIGKRRALVLAQHEILYAYNEGLLDSYEDLGVRQLTVVLELVTAQDDRVCPKCKALLRKRKYWTVKQARGVLPYHVSCRCRWRAKLKPKRTRQRVNPLFVR